MPCLPRLVLPGQPHHVIQRGNNRSPIFVADDDYWCFRDYLKEACDFNGCQIHAYVFMANHVYLLITPVATDSISKTM